MVFRAGCVQGVEIPQDGDLTTSLFSSITRQAPRSEACKSRTGKTGPYLVFLAEGCATRCGRLLTTLLSLLFPARKFWDRCSLLVSRPGMAFPMVFVWKLRI